MYCFFIACTLSIQRIYPRITQRTRKGKRLLGLIVICSLSISAWKQFSIRHYRAEDAEKQIISFFASFAFFADKFYIFMFFRLVAVWFEIMMLPIIFKVKDVIQTNLTIGYYFL